MSLPLIYLAFANDSESPLPAISREHDALQELLTDGASRQFYQLHPDPFASIEKVSRNLSAFRDRVYLFHFGGHAGGRQLILTDQEANSDGIAGMLAGQKNLKLVFLNGCSTREQVRLLLDKGIPAVIATSAPINDESAGMFARQFYHALARQHSIEEAFQQAASAVKAAGAHAPKAFRGIDTAENDPGAEGLPWGLYTREGVEEILSWKLPGQRIFASYEPPGWAPNSFIINVLFQALAPYDQNLQAEQARLRAGEDVSEWDVRPHILNCLPSPIAEQLRKLFAPDGGYDKASPERLEKLIYAYSVTMELLAFIMLAQLWDLMWNRTTRNEDIALTPETRANLLEYFRQDEGSIQSFNFIPLIRSARQFLDRKEEAYFLKELEEVRKIYESGGTFSAAIGFMEQLKKEWAAGLTGLDAASLCYQAEEQLAEVFRVLGFLAKYKLRTIKNIYLIRQRHQQPRYRHSLIELERVSSGIQRDRTFEVYADNQSVVFLKSDKDVGEYLNLSPFVLDKSAFTNDHKSFLFFFSHYDKAGKGYCYKYANDPSRSLEVKRKQPALALSLSTPGKKEEEPDYGKAIDEFETFFELVMGTKPEAL